MSVSRNRSAARHRLEQQVNAEALSFVDGFRPLSPRPCEAAMARPKVSQHGVKHWWSVLVRWWQSLKAKIQRQSMCSLVAENQSQLSDRSEGLSESGMQGGGHRIERVQTRACSRAGQAGQGWWQSFRVEMKRKFL